MQDRIRLANKTGHASIAAVSANGALCWHAVFCKPRQETTAKEHLQRQGFEVYLPRISGRHRKRNRWVDSIQALFPRYLFVRIDRRRQGMASIRSTRGVVDLVRFGVEPAVVPDPVIDAIVACEHSAKGLDCHTQKGFLEGEMVTMLEGPFTGMQGIFENDDGDERAVLLIDLLGKANRVRVNRDWIAHVS